MSHGLNLTKTWPGMCTVQNESRLICFRLIISVISLFIFLSFHQFWNNLKVKWVNQQLTYGEEFSLSLFVDWKRWHCGFQKFWQKTLIVQKPSSFKINLTVRFSVQMDVNEVKEFRKYVSGSTWCTLLLSTLIFT